MRYTILIVLIALAIVFLRHRPAPTPTQSTPPATPTPRPASEHHWPKRAIDRAQDVAQQVKRERASNENP